MIYVVPVITYLKMQRLEIENPLLAAALQENEVSLLVPQHRPEARDFASSPKSGSAASGPGISLSPKMVISDRFLKRAKMGATPKKEDESDTILTYSPNNDKDKEGYSPIASDNTESKS